MGMPFAPCSDSACSDETSIQMLKYVFGPVIDGLLSGEKASQIEASANILATMFSVYASGIMLVSGFIVSAIVIGSVMNTANDGEVMGKNWSTPNTILRVVSGGGVLLPTTSGFSIIQLIVLVLALWGVGFANLTYKTGVVMGVLSPAGIVSAAATPGSYYGMRDFAKQYMGAMYCARVANAAYAMSSGARASVQMNGGAGTAIGSRMEYSYNVSDTNSATNLAGGAPICGVVKLSLYGPQNLTDKQREQHQISLRLRSNERPVWRHVHDRPQRRGHACLQDSKNPPHHDDHEHGVGERGNHNPEVERQQLQIARDRSEPLDRDGQQPIPKRGGNLIHLQAGAQEFPAADHASRDPGACRRRLEKRVGAKDGKILQGQIVAHAFHPIDGASHLTCRAARKHGFSVVSGPCCHSDDRFH